MRAWKNKIKVRHLFTEQSDRESIQKSMNDIADALEASRLFIGLGFDKWRNIPADENGLFSAEEYANKLIGYMYDFADDRRIWID